MTRRLFAAVTVVCAAAWGCSPVVIGQDASGGSEGGGNDGMVVLPEAGLDAGPDAEAGNPCPSPGTVCSGQCVDLQSSRSNCGTCGRACTGTDLCVAGTCQASCPSGQAACAGACVDLRTDRSHCGACGAQCRNGEVCSMGSCLANCAPSLATCVPSAADAGTLADGAVLPSYCADTSTDRNNCGGCGMRCRDGYLCQGSTCVLACAGTLVACNGACRDFATDPRNCGSCGAACGDGQLCVSGRCVTSCTAPLSVCNGVCRDTNNDPGACGTCSTVCPTGPHGTAICAQGGCGLRCETGYADCDGMGSNGCETALNTVSNCGGCGLTCRFAGATATCGTSGCQFAACTTGFGNCDGNTANGCEMNLLSSRVHCGACNRACADGEVCSNGMCTATCSAPLTNCSGSCRNTNNDPEACGTCATRCASGPNSSPTCSGGTCGLLCAAGYGNCDGNAANGCETRLDTAANCGACANACAFANAGATCTMGRCAIGACNTGFDNCDAQPANGCEADLNNDATRCGACGTSCTAPAGTTPVCVAGTCATACPPGRLNCDGNATNGCETDAQSDTANCGACGRACPTPGANATAVCRTGVCGASCATGYADCNRNPSDGCEVATNTTSNCGACGVSCGSTGTSSATCGTGGCSLTCSANRLDCNRNPADGCEADTTTTSNCGGCGIVCGAAGTTTATCTAGACVETCATNRANCNGNAADGCEVGLLADPANCGTCGTACAAGEYCANGMCAAVPACTLALGARIQLNVPVEGTFSAMSVGPAASCGSTAAGGEVAHLLRLAARTTVSISLSNTAASDTVLYVRRACADATSEVACNDDGGTGSSSFLTVTLDPGEYYVIADGYSSSVVNLPYTLLVQAAETEPANGQCAAALPLTPGTSIAGSTTGGLNTPLFACSTSDDLVGTQAFYALAIPAFTSMRVTATPASGSLRIRSGADCAASTCTGTAASASAGGAAMIFLSNTTPYPVTRIVSVGGYNQAAVGFTLQATALPFAGQTNNYCSAARDISTNPALDQNLAAATETLGTRTGCGTTTANVLYYSLTVPAGRLAVVTAAPTGFDLDLRVLSACSATTCAQRINGSSTAGVPETALVDNGTGTAPLTVLLAVGSTSSTTTGAFSISAALQTAPAQRACGAAIDVSTTPATAQQSILGGESLGARSGCGTTTGGVQYYSVSIPAFGFATVTVTPVGFTPVLRVLPDCGTTSACASNATGTSGTALSTTIENPTTSAIQRIVAVSASTTTANGSFTVASTTGRMPYTRSTSMPAVRDPNVGAEPALAAPVSDDSASASFTFPFPFSYFGTAVQSYSISSNGFLILSDLATAPTSAAYSNTALASTTINGMVAPLWDDLVPTSSPGVRTYVSGNAGSRVLIVEWSGWELLSASGSIVIQVKFYEATNVIEFHYVTLTGITTTSATIGLRSIDGTKTSQVSFNTAAAVSENSLIAFTPQ